MRSDISNDVAGFIDLGRFISQNEQDNPYCFERDGREQRNDTGLEWIIKAGYRLFFSRLYFKSERASELLLCEPHVEFEYEKQQESST